MNPTIPDLIESLRDAAKQVAEATGNDYIFSGVEIQHGEEPEFFVYNKVFHRAPTLEQAVEKAIAFDSKAAKLKEAAALRAQADALEDEAL